jgi:polysaccharide biosynthesis/export protein
MDLIFDSEQRSKSPDCGGGGGGRRVERGRFYGGQMLLVGVGILVGGCQSPKGAMLADAPERLVTHRPVTLAAGDVVRLSFAGSPDFNQVQKVRADGKLSLPVIGEVDAAGKRLPDFQAELSRRYKDQLRNNEVLVSLDSGSLPVIVSGAVIKPGKIAFDRPLTVLDVIMESGGIAPVGDPKKVHLIRLSGGRHQTQVIDLRPILKGKAADALYVRGGDVIFVEERLF